MTYVNRRFHLPFALAATAATIVLTATTPADADNDKVTICHAAGRDGTTHYNTLTISRSAVSAHFDEHGTPQAGHEDDYFGACVGDTTTSTTEASTTSSTTTNPSTSTTSPTTSTAPPTSTSGPSSTSTTSTTTLPASTTTEPGATTSTTSAPTSTELLTTTSNLMSSTSITSTPTTSPPSGPSTPPVPPSSTLPATGPYDPLPIVLVGAGFVCLGLILARRHHDGVGR